MGTQQRSRLTRFLRALAGIGCALPLVWSVSAHADVTKPTVELTRSSVVVFEVRHTEHLYNAEQFGAPPEPMIQLIAPDAKRYAAVYFPAAHAGWVQVTDPDAPHNPPLVAPIGKVKQWGFKFTPHHRYWMVVALDRPGRIVFPDVNYHVVGFHHREIINVTLAIKPLLVPGGNGNAVAGFTRNKLGDAQASMVALSVDYDHSSSRVINGDACVAPLPAYPCSLDQAGLFRASWWATGKPGQDTVGRAYTAAPTDCFITGDFEVLYGAKFQAARLIAFGLRYDQ